MTRQETPEREGSISTQERRRDEATDQSNFDVEQILSLEPYEVIDNPAVDQQYRFIERGTDDGVEYLWVEIRYGPNSNYFPEHVHPEQDKRFEVLSGTFVVTIDGDERDYGPGEGATIPAGASQYYRGTDGEETRVLWEIRPAMALDELLRMTAVLAREGKTNADGSPKLLDMAVFLNANRNLTYFTSPPVAVQKILFRVLGPIGRLLGRKADYSAEAVGTSDDASESTITTN